MLTAGLTYTARTVVDAHNTAAAYGSGNINVFATPAMIALMENAARHAVAEHLPEGASTVGTAVNIVHTRATPIGDEVFATATLKSTDGRLLVFEVVAADAQGEIGRGSHTRFVIEVERFMGKLKK